MRRVPPVRTRARTRLLLALLSGVLFTACGPETGQPPPVPRADGPLAHTLKTKVDTNSAVTHLHALQKIADENGGNRAAPGPGFNASVDYVAATLRGSGYEVSTPTYGLAAADGMEPRNVIAQTRTGNPDQVVTIGAHADSVRQGPGIVDNGSGVATLLEIAGRLGASAPLRNAVRFAFFGSEEAGSRGAKGYVASLSADERAKIMLYLNVDMVASPNGGYLVQGGEGDGTHEAGPPGSAVVGGVLADQLAKTGVNAKIVGFGGDDEAPFVNAGIPAGGAENGNRKDKSEEGARLWGGQADEPFDPCYHRACDRTDNVNPVVLDHYLHAIAGTVAYFATSDRALSG
jgi:aminopeptidase S